MHTDNTTIATQWNLWTHLVGASHFAEVVLSLEVKMYREGTTKSIFCREVFLLCPLFGASYIGGSITQTDKI